MFAVGTDKTGWRYSAFAPGTQNPLTLNGPWTQGLAVGLDWADVQIAGGHCYGTQTGNGSDGLNQAPTKYDDSTVLVPGVWPKNQQAEAVIFNNEIAGNWNSEVEIRLRSVITAHVNRGYEFNVRVKSGGPGYVEIIGWNGAIGDFTSLEHNEGSQYLVVTGDMIRAIATGRILELWLRQSGVWTLRASHDTTNDAVVWSDGNPGFGFYLNNQGATGDVSRYGFTSFTAKGA